MENKTADNLVVRGIENDSRRVSCGDVFLAYRGETAHGLDFLPQALERGAAAVLWDDDRDAIACPQFNLAVPDLRHRAGIIASRFYGNPTAALPVIAVTGTDGKTSVAHFVAQALSAARKRCGIIGTLGMGFLGALRDSPNTTPDSLVIHKVARELADARADCLVLEASSHGIDQGRLSGLAVDVAVLTNIGTDHSDYHASREAYAAAKCKLFETAGLGYAIINRDSAYRDAAVARCAKETTILEYSTHDKTADVCLQGLSSTPSGLTLRLLVEGREQVLQSALLGEFNAQNLMAALLVLMTQGFAPERALRRLSRARPAPGRMESFACSGHGMIVLDYAHTPEALKKVLQACRGYCSGRIICVFGCGGERDRAKRPMMGGVASLLADQVIITNDNPRNEAPEQIVRDIRQGIGAHAHTTVIAERRDAIERGIVESRPGDVVVVAGKGHETQQITGSGAVPFDDKRVIRAVMEKAR